MLFYTKIKLVVSYTDEITKSEKTISSDYFDLVVPSIPPSITVEQPVWNHDDNSLSAQFNVSNPASNKSKIQKITVTSAKDEITKSGGSPNILKSVAGEQTFKISGIKKIVNFDDLVINISYLDQITQKSNTVKASISPINIDGKPIIEGQNVAIRDAKTGNIKLTFNVTPGIQVVFDKMVSSSLKIGNNASFESITNATKFGKHIAIIKGLKQPGTYDDIKVIISYHFITSSGIRSNEETLSVSFNKIVVPTSLGSITSDLIYGGAGLLIAIVLATIMIVLYIRTRDAKAFAKYEARLKAKQEESTQKFGLATIESNLRTKKETRKAIKDWKKRTKAEKHNMIRVNSILSWRVECTHYWKPEPGTSGLEKTAPPGELEFSSRSN